MRGWDGASPGVRVQVIIGGVHEIDTWMPTVTTTSLPDILFNLLEELANDET
jgi:hypothetical protein